MTCGSSYAHLLVTEDGKTPADPYTWPPTVLDYDEWHDVAHTVGHEVFQRWDWLLAIENDLVTMEEPPVPGPYPERDQLLFLLQSFAERLAGVQHVLLESFDLNGITWEPSIREAIATAEDGTCVLEMLDAAAAYYQRPPLPERHPPPEPDSGDDGSGDGEAGGGLGGVLMTGALAVGAVLLWRRHKRRKERR